MFNFHYSYQTLPSSFYTKISKHNFPNLKAIIFNSKLAQELDLKYSDQMLENPGELAREVFSNQQNFSMAYSGHQFGHFNPLLGDGRAMLLGEHLTLSGKRYDIHAKGSGPTPYSRNGDGLCALGPALREYIVSEAMASLGVPTSRVLAVLTTGEEIYRDGPQIGAILIRVASSHIRIGTFEYAALINQTNEFHQFALYTLKRHFPHISPNSPELFEELFLGISQNLISLVSLWMRHGFIHGVMNTDNMAISGETLDFGPCAFMDQFKWDQVYSFIDRQGRYAYKEQPQIMLWNLSVLLNTFMNKAISSPISRDRAEELLNTNTSFLNKSLISQFTQMLGLNNHLNLPEETLTNWFNALETDKEDFTLGLFKLKTGLIKKISPFPDSSELNNFFKNFSVFLGKNHPGLDPRCLETTPIFIPRNHLVEKAIQLANKGNLTFVHQLVEKLNSPFWHPQLDLDQETQWISPPNQDERVHYTFCGT